MSGSKAWQVDRRLWVAQLGIVVVALGLFSVDIDSSQAQFQSAVNLGQLSQVAAQPGHDRPYQPPKRGIPGRREAAGSR